MNDNAISLVIIILFIIGLTLFGKFVSTKVKTSDDYLIADRNINFGLIVGTVFASFWGGGTIIGASGEAFHGGIYAVIGDPFAAGLGLILLGFLFVKPLRKLNLKSIGELYKERFGQNTSYLASALMIPTYIIWTAVQLLAIGKILNVMFNVNFILVFVISAIVISIFTYLGGLVAVVWTDAIQMIIIFIGLIIILYIGIKTVGGVNSLTVKTPVDYWNIAPKAFSFKEITVYIALWAGMSLGNVPSPDLAQRALMAKNEKVASRGMITAGLLYWIVGLIPIVLALIGITLVNQGKIDANLINSDSELLIPIMAKYLLNPVLLGVFIASLVAAILSSASTSLFATAVLMSNDIFMPLMKKYKPQRHFDELKTTRIFVLFACLLGVLVGLLSNQIYDLTIFAFTLQLGMLFFPFVLALKSKKVNRYGIIAGMFVGIFINLFGCFINKTLVPEPFEFYTLFPALANLITIITISHFTNCEKDTNLEDILLKKQKEYKEN
jgi:SSS family transporter